MPHDNERIDENEWTPDELAQLRSLSSERIPPAELKARTAQTLRDRGLLASRYTIAPRIWVAIAAAASIVFAAGAAVGYAAAVRRSTVVPAGGVETTQAVARAESASAAKPARQVVWF